MKYLTKIKQWAKQLKSNVVMLGFALKDPDMPMFPKWICIFVVAYALSPIDLIPDFVPVLGYLDDLILLPILIAMALSLTPTDVKERAQIKAQEWLASGESKSRSWGGLGIVLLIWVAMGAGIYLGWFHS